MTSLTFPPSIIFFYTIFCTALCICTQKRHLFLWGKKHSKKKSKKKKKNATVLKKTVVVALKGSGRTTSIPSVVQRLRPTMSTDPSSPTWWDYSAIVDTTKMAFSSPFLLFLLPILFLPTDPTQRTCGAGLSVTAGVPAFRSSRWALFQNEVSDGVAERGCCFLCYFCSIFVLCSAILGSSAAPCEHSKTFV